MQRTAKVLAALMLICTGFTAVVFAEKQVALEDFRLVNLAGMEATAIDGPPDAATTIRFSKVTQPRRLLAVQARPSADPAGVKSLDIRYRLRDLSGQQPKLAVIFFDGAGGSWYQLWPFGITVDEVHTIRLPVGALAETAFSAAEEDINWSDIGRAWLGLAIDGEAEGVFEIYAAHMTDSPYKPTSPLEVPVGDVSAWSASQNSAVSGEITTPQEGPEGQTCMKYEFTMPGGSHRWAIPQRSVQSSALLGSYSGLKFRYRANLPEGIDGLLIVLRERGGAQYYADPAPPPADEWTEITLPFATFKEAGWAEDKNDEFDLGQINQLHIGCHGTPAGKGGDGLIMATDIQFVP